MAAGSNARGCGNNDLAGRRNPRATALCLLALSLSSTGCTLAAQGLVLLLYPPPSGICEQEDRGPIIIDDTSEFVVPDQESGACNRVSVQRVIMEDVDRELILRAERHPSTVGDTWWNPTSSDMFGFLIGWNRCAAPLCRAFS